jgi:pSer/pThr/pTyr-binding forkhead associated (FHA) protein
MPTYGLRDRAGRLISISQATSIGRGPSCGIRVPDDRLVAAIHALVWVDDYSLRVRDERTVNGTYVNEERLRPGLGRELAAGDTLRVGASVWAVEVVPEGTPASAERPMTGMNLPARTRPLPDWVVVVGAVAAVVAAAAAAIVALGNR